MVITYEIYEYYSFFPQGGKTQYQFLNEKYIQQNNETLIPVYENITFFPHISLNILPSKPNYSLINLEKYIYELINKERILYNLTPLKWNDHIASVAREHSYYLAKENKILTNFYSPCPVPIVHHEGFDFGMYHDDRLNNRSIYYFQMSAENIFIGPTTKNKTYKAFKPVKCPSFSEIEERQNESIAERMLKIKEEIRKREEFARTQQLLKWIKVIWKNEEEIAKETVTSWMSSPGHRKNILTPEFDETGIGIAEVNDYVIITQVFIKRALCGYKGGKCCREYYYSYCYAPLKCVWGVCKE